MYRKSAQGWLKHIDFILWDVCIIQISFILGYMIRHGWGRWPYLQPDYRTLSIILCAADLFVAIAFNTMHNVMKRGYLKEFVASVKHASLVLVVMSLYLFTTQSGDVYSRITIYLTAVFHLILGYSTRLLWKPVVKRINKGKLKGTMILVAEEQTARQILNEEELRGIRCTGLILSDRNGTGETIKGIRVVADLDNAADYICREWVDEVYVYPSHLSDLKTVSSYSIDNAKIITNETDTKTEIDESETLTGVAALIGKCREMAVPVHIHLPVSISSGKSFLEKYGNYSVLTITANSITPRQQFLKRGFDVFSGLIGSFVTLIIIAVIGPRIKKESPGPILFRQTRIGQNGKKFTIFKIRSMYMDAEAKKQELMNQNKVSDGMMFKMDFDPRIIGNKIVDGKQVTGIGERIRASSLDEFPQFFNVLKGDMSMVGTRPPTEDEWEKYKLHHRARLATKPGLTGMWQVSGRSRITDFEEVVKLDTEYINNWSIGLDLKILAKTVKTVLKKDGAM